MTERVQSLQALRGVAFLLIFCSHCTFIEAFSSSWGGIGVSVFIVLSGYVVTFNSNSTSIRKKDIKTIPYLKKRVKKIYPLHIIMLCVRLAFDCFRGIEIPTYVILLNLTMLKSFVPKREVFYSLGGVSWYLTLVWFFALLTPFLLKLTNTVIKAGGGGVRVFTYAGVSF